MRIDVTVDGVKCSGSAPSDALLDLLASSASMPRQSAREMWDSALATPLPLPAAFPSGLEVAAVEYDDGALRVTVHMTPEIAHSLYDAARMAGGLANVIAFVRMMSAGFKGMPGDDEYSEAPASE